MAMNEKIRLIIDTDPGQDPRQRLDIGRPVIDAEARASGRLDAQRLHQRLRAMMAGADRHALFVQDSAEIVRMHPVDGKGDDARGIGRPEQPHAVDRAETIPRSRDQRGCGRSGR